MPIEQVEFEGWKNCYRLSNRETEIVVATEIGLRILRFGFHAGPNAFYLDPASAGKTGGDDWTIYGGHRLWQAPEAFPGSYTPDNFPVASRIEGDRLIVTQPADPATGMIKEIEIRLDAESNTAEIDHRLINTNPVAVRCAPWAISVMTPGGTAIVPQEPYGEGNDFLLPARSLALWSYTRMEDLRWTWGNRFVHARQDGSGKGEQKAGFLNRQGWTAYFFQGHCFIKQFNFEEKAVYADMGCNNEIYFNPDFLEIESLGPLMTLAPDARVDHSERWTLLKMPMPVGDTALEEQLLPLLKPFTNT